MRRLNRELLNSYVIVNGRLGREILAVDSKIPFVLIDRLLKGKRNATELEMDSLCKVTGFPLDQLFPIDRQEEEKKLA